MRPTFTQEEENFRQEIRRFITSEKKSSKARGLPSDVFVSELYAKMTEKGWTGMFIPKEYGGTGRKETDWAILIEELAYSGAPEILRTALDMISFIGGGLMIPCGSPEVKRKFLPGLCTGDITVSIGSTEPATGLDMDLFTTRAVDKGDHFIVNGVKIYNEAHRSNHLCVILQTAPEAKSVEHKMSVIMVDLASPGVSVRPLWMMWGLRRDEVVLDNVKVPKENLIGPKDGMYQYVVEALSAEWGTLSNVGTLRRDYERFIELLKATGGSRLLSAMPGIRNQLAELEMELEIGRLLFYKTWWLREQRKPAGVTGAMAKIHVTELWPKLYGVLTEIAGQSARLEGLEAAMKWPMARLGLTYSYEFSPSLTIGGGPTETQRDYVAQQGFGLSKANGG